MSAVARKSWVCGPPTNRDPIVLAILNILWGPRNGSNCERYAAPVPPAPTATEIVDALSNQYSEEQVLDRLRLWTRRGLFQTIPCENVDDPVIRFRINPIAGQVNRQNWLYLSPNAIIPVDQNLTLCCFNPCVSKKGAIESLDNFRFVRQRLILNAQQRQTLIDQRNPADTPCGQINCQEVPAS